MLSTVCAQQRKPSRTYSRRIFPRPYCDLIALGRLGWTFDTPPRLALCWNPPAYCKKHTRKKATNLTFNNSFVMAMWSAKHIFMDTAPYKIFVRYYLCQQRLTESSKLLGKTSTTCKMSCFLSATHRTGKGAWRNCSHEAAFHWRAAHERSRVRFHESFGQAGEHHRGSRLRHRCRANAGGSSGLSLLCAFVPDRGQRLLVVLMFPKMLSLNWGLGAYSSGNCGSYIPSTLRLRSVSRYASQQRLRATCCRHFWKRCSRPLPRPYSSPPPNGTLKRRASFKFAVMMPSRRAVTFTFCFFASTQGQRWVSEFLSASVVARSLHYLSLTSKPRFDTGYPFVHTGHSTPDHPVVLTLPSPICLHLISNWAKVACIALRQRDLWRWHALPVRRCKATQWKSKGVWFLATGGQEKRPLFSANRSKPKRFHLLSFQLSRNQAVLGVYTTHYYRRL